MRSYTVGVFRARRNSGLLAFFVPILPKGISSSKSTMFEFMRGDWPSSRSL